MTPEEPQDVEVTGVAQRRTAVQEFAELLGCHVAPRVLRRVSGPLPWSRHSMSRRLGDILPHFRFRPVRGAAGGSWWRPLVELAETRQGRRELIRALRERDLEGPRGEPAARTRSVQPKEVAHA